MAEEVSSLDSLEKGSSSKTTSKRRGGPYLPSLFCPRLQALTWNDGLKLASEPIFHQSEDFVKSVLVVDVTLTDALCPWIAKFLKLYENHDTIDAVVIQVSVPKHEGRTCSHNCEHHFLAASVTQTSQESLIAMYLTMNVSGCIKMKKFAALMDSLRPFFEKSGESVSYKLPVVFLPKEDPKYQAEPGISFSDGLRKAFPKLKTAAFLKLDLNLKDLMYVDNEDVKNGFHALRSSDQLCVFGVLPIELPWKGFGFELTEMRALYRKNWNKWTADGVTEEEEKEEVERISEGTNTNESILKYPYVKSSVKEAKLSYLSPEIDSKEYTKFYLFRRFFYNAILLNVWTILYCLTNFMPNVQVFGRALWGRGSKNFESLPNTVTFQRCDVSNKIMHSRYAKNNGYDKYLSMNDSAYVLRDQNVFRLLKRFCQSYVLFNLANLVGLVGAMASFILHFLFIRGLIKDALSPDLQSLWDVPIVGYLLVTVFTLITSLTQVFGVLVISLSWAYVACSYFSIVSDSNETTRKNASKEEDLSVQSISGKSCEASNPWLYRKKYVNERTMMFGMSFGYSLFGILAVLSILAFKVVSLFEWVGGWTNKSKVAPRKQSKRR